MAASISKNTKKSYETGLTAFENFRLDLGYQQIWPPPLDHVVQFIAYLSCKDNTYSTARAYVSAISFQSKIHNIADITKNFIVSKLLEGMKRIKKSVDSRLPITLSLLTKIFQILPAICYNSYEIRLFRAAYVLAFHGFFRVGEFSLSVGNSVHSILQVSDVQFELNFFSVCIRIRSSKSDQHSRGVTVAINKIGGILCPVGCLNDFLLVRGKSDGPLFIHSACSGGRALTMYQFSSVLEKALNTLGIQGRFKAHSFRIWAATAAFEAGCSPEAIMEAGRWKSKVYKSYIRCPVLDSCQ